MLIELLRSRRSVRAFTDQQVEQEKLDLLIEAALRSPHSPGKAPWRLFVVRDAETIARLAEAKAHGASFVKGAPLAIVICADPAISDVWVEYSSAVAMLVHLEAHDLGLGSCWVQIRDRKRADGQSAEDYVVELLGADPSLAVEAIVAIGYAAEEKEGRPAEELPFEKVSFTEAPGA